MIGKSLNIPKELRVALWPHQREAIAFAWSRLQVKSSKNVTLVRMPTGTGKTGVIAVLCVVDSPVGWSLILTPWKHLCDQMIEDIGGRFWESRGWTPSMKPKVLRLFPRTLGAVLADQSPSLVLVATFATLVAIFTSKNSQIDRTLQREGILGQMQSYFRVVGYARTGREFLQADFAIRDFRFSTTPRVDHSNTIRKLWALSGLLRAVLYDHSSGLSFREAFNCPLECNAHRFFINCCVSEGAVTLQAEMIYGPRC